MKVLFISSGNGSFGINPIVKNQGESLKSAGVELQYFLIEGKGIVSYLKHVIILRRYIRNNAFDIFHAHYSLSAFTASLAGCKPLVVSLMGSDTNSGIFWKLIIQLFSFFRWKAIVLKSFSMKVDIGIKNAYIIPNGVDITRIKPSNQSNRTGTKTVLFAADPKRYSKNYSLAESAMSQIRETDAVLRVVHSVSQDTIIREINSSDVLLLTSRWEGSPNIIKEAMACNCPIVSTNVGDVEWLFGNEPGHYLTSFEATDIAEKIKFALDFVKRTGRTKGRKRIMKLGLDSKTKAKRIIKLYEETLNS